MIFEINAYAYKTSQNVIKSKQLSTQANPNSAWYFKIF
jgi:hypothetical protein